MIDWPFLGDASKTLSESLSPHFRRL